MLDYNRPFDASSMERYYFKPVLAQLGIEGLTWHDLRHYFASLCAAAAYDIRFVSRWGTPTSTSPPRPYTHLFNSEHDMDALDAAAERARATVVPVVPLRTSQGSVGVWRYTPSAHTPPITPIPPPPPITPIPPTPPITPIPLISPDTWESGQFGSGRVMSQT